MRAEVWVNTRERYVLLAEEQGGVLDFAIVNPATGQADGYLVGHYEMPSHGWGWGQAARVAEAKARELGYRIDYEAPSMRGLYGVDEDEEGE